VKEYTVWIVAPQRQGGLFRLNIHQRWPLSPSPDRVGRTLLTREELRTVLLRSLPAGQNSLAIVEAIIVGTMTHSFDLKSKGPMLLSDEAAHRLGWDFSSETSLYAL
jgi:hypothetical protein